VTAASLHTLLLLARRIRHLNEEVRDLDKRITDAVKAIAPDLLEEFGVGPHSAAILLTSQATPNACEVKHRSPRYAASAQSRRPRARAGASD
jgi:RNA processing factor Prp31